MIMLCMLALLADARARERWSSFLWTFAVWDLAYYAGLWGMLRWPTSLTDYDVLFLIPVPWIAQVWFPLLVSTLSLLTVALCRARGHLAREPMSRGTDCYCVRGQGTGFERSGIGSVSPFWSTLEA